MSLWPTTKPHLVRADVGLTHVGLTILLIAGPVRSSAVHAFPLVSRAISASHTLIFAARQKIVMSPARNAAQARPTKIVADVLQDKERVRLTYLLPAEAAHRVVVDDGHTVRQWEPSQRVILVDQSRVETPSTQQKMLRLLHKNYRCTLLRQTRINGLLCSVISVQPRPGHAGPTRRLWIEDKRFAVLRTEEFDAAGTLRYLSFYETFRYISPPPSHRFTLPTDARVCRVGRQEHAEPNTRAAFAAAHIPGRLPCWLPPGYALIGSAVAPDQGGHCAVLHYGDGLKMFSIVERAARTGEESPAQGALSRDGVQVWGLVAGPLRLAVVGDSTLPTTVGPDVMQALRPQNAATLRHRLADDFGVSALHLAARLRRRGWGYDRIAALCLSLKTRQGHPHPTQRAPRLPSPRWERQGRLWIAAVLHGL